MESLKSKEKMDSETAIVAGIMLTPFVVVSIFTMFCMLIDFLEWLTLERFVWCLITFLVISHSIGIIVSVKSLKQRRKQ